MRRVRSFIRVMRATPAMWGNLRSTSRVRHDRPRTDTLLVTVTKSDGREYRIHGFPRRLLTPDFLGEAALRGDHVEAEEEA